VAEGAKEADAVSVTLEELEAVRLVDLLDLDQEEAAFYMGVSRKAFWNDLMGARKRSLLPWSTGRAFALREVALFCEALG